MTKSALTTLISDASAPSSESTVQPNENVSISDQVPSAELKDFDTSVNFDHIKTVIKDLLDPKVMTNDDFIDKLAIKLATNDDFIEKLASTVASKMFQLQNKSKAEKFNENCKIILAQLHTKCIFHDFLKEFSKNVSF